MSDSRKRIDADLQTFQLCEDVNQLKWAVRAAVVARAQRVLEDDAFLTSEVEAYVNQLKAMHDMGHVHLKSFGTHAYVPSSDKLN